MKGSFCNVVKNVYKRLSVVNIKWWLRIAYALSLFVIIYNCFSYYPEWSKVPTHYLKLDVEAKGKLSSKSYCEFLINIDAGGDYFDKSKAKMNNRVLIYNDTLYNMGITEQKGDFKFQMKQAFGACNNKLRKMNTYYRLGYNYYVSLILPSKKSKEEPQIKCDNTFMSYTGVPYVEQTNKDTRVSGEDYLAYGEIVKTGHMGMSTRVMNESPSIFSPWDITQANYILYLQTDDIRCRRIKFDFIGSTSFSNMEPSPDKTTVNSIEFTDPVKIMSIINNGLRFHARFVEQQEKSAIRIFVLTSILSLVISLFASVVRDTLF
ncbi:MAG: hypothetical protein IJQ04_07405 [Prevotella sp.]|nr:hypothetical protein [Prevotella sp.]